MTLPKSNHFSLKNNKKKLLIYTLIGLGIFLIVICLLVFRPQLEKIFNKGCSPSLAIGDSSYEFKTLTPISDGAFKIPDTHPERAYWITGTTTNNVFVFISSSENQALIKGLSEKDKAVITWANCNSTTYTLTPPTQGNLKNAVQDQTISQLTLVIPMDDALNGPMVIGNLQGETITSFNTPVTSVAQFDVTLMGIVTSDDKSKITVDISLNNYGEIPVDLALKDFGLTPDGGTMIGLLTSDPNLPISVQPGETQSFKISFAHPSTPSATLKILSLEMLIDGY